MCTAKQICLNHLVCWLIRTFHRHSSQLSIEPVLYIEYIYRIYSVHISPIVCANGHYSALILAELRCIFATLKARRLAWNSDERKLMMVYFFSQFVGCRFCRCSKTLCTSSVFVSVGYCKLHADPMTNVHGMAFGLMSRCVVKC